MRPKSIRRIQKAVIESLSKGKRRENNGNDLAQKIIREGLWKRLSHFQEMRTIPLMWPDLAFTPQGIISTSQVRKEVYLSYQTLPKPSITLLTKSPLYRLQIVLVKNVDTCRKQQETEGQVTCARAYIQENPPYLYKFLEQQKIPPDDIRRLTIGFSGVAPTSGGFIETDYEPNLDLAELLR